MMCSLRIWFSILSLLFVLDPCWSMPRLRSHEYGPTTPRVTGQPHRNMDISLEFSHFESRMSSYIDDVKRGLFETMSDASRFLEEVDKYIARLPVSATKIVNTRSKDKVATLISLSRDVCHCEGQMMTPCPARCLYSCYLHNYNAYKTNEGWHYEDDCRERSWSEYKCTDDSSTRFDTYADLESCINRTTELVPANTTCLQYSVNRKDLVEAFERVTNLLMEPLRKYFRGVGSQLTLLKQLSLNIKGLSNIATHVCSEGNDTNCSTHTDQLLSELKTNYHQLQRNITMELIKSQSRIEAVSLKVDKLKELMFAKINRLIKEYSCCLNTLDFSLDGYDCSDMNTELNFLSTTEISTTIRSSDSVTAGGFFICANGRSTLKEYVCDGRNDCDDGSDETNC